MTLRMKSSYKITNQREMENEFKDIEISLEIMNFYILSRKFWRYLAQLRFSAHCVTTFSFALDKWTICLFTNYHTLSLLFHISFGFPTKLFSYMDGSTVKVVLIFPSLQLHDSRKAWTSPRSRPKGFGHNTYTTINWYMPHAIMVFV